MDMGSHDQYGFSDLRQLLAGRSCFPPATLPVTQPGGVLEHPHFISDHHRNSVQHQQQQQQHYNMLMLGGSHLQVGAGGGGGGGNGGGGGDRHHPQEVVMPGHGVMMNFCPAADSTTNNAHTNNNVISSTSAATNGTSASSGGGGGVCGLLEMEEGCNTNGGGGGINGDNGVNNNRWPRQETLTLLEIRFSLDPKFKEANQKGPLWDDVSRIMAEEHGYQRSGKKCREKFENLYKYYKKTKEGKAGRQDGKSYRYFRQLEAIVGDSTSNNTPTDTHFDNLGFHVTTNISTQSHNQKLGLGWQQQPHDHKLSESFSPSNVSEFENSSFEDDDDVDDINSISFLEDGSLMENKNKNPSLKRNRKSWKAKIRDFIDSRTKKWMEKQEAWLDNMLKTLEQKEQERIVREEEWRRQEMARIDEEHKFWAKQRAWLIERDATLMEALQRFVGTDIKISSRDERMTRDYHENSENLNENATKAIEKEVISHDRWTSEAETSSRKHLRTGMEVRVHQDGSEHMRTQSNDGPSSSNTNAGKLSMVHESSFQYMTSDEGDNNNLWENYGVKLNKGRNHQN